MCNSSIHDVNLCLYYICYTQPDIASPRDNIGVVLTLLDLSFPLAKCTGFKKGDFFGGLLLGLLLMVLVMSMKIR